MYNVPLEERLQVQPILVRTTQVVTVPRGVELALRPSAAITPAQAVQALQAAPHVRPTPAPVVPLVPAAIVPVPAQNDVVVRRRNASLIPNAPRQLPRNHVDGVHYITPDISQEDLERVRNLRGLGRDRILVIVGNGPSILETDLPRLSGVEPVDIMSINKPDPRLWPTRYWMFCDVSQYDRHRDLWESYTGLIINSTAIQARRNNSVQLKHLGGFGFSRDLITGFHIGRSTVYAAMQVAMWLDYPQVYIFGCDMCEVPGKPLHFYGNNPDVEPDVRKSRFDTEAEYYAHAVLDLTPEERRIFTFCTRYNRYSFVDEYGRLDHQEAIDVILRNAAAKAPAPAT